jgi:hypothetical protein
MSLLALFASLFLIRLGYGFFSKACNDQDIDDFDDPALRPILQSIGGVITIIGVMGFTFSLRTLQ